MIGPCHIRRIEGGILAFGCDMWYDTNPFEVGMGYTWMVDLGQEADFVGKEALRRSRPRARSASSSASRSGAAVGTYIDSEMIDMFPVLQAASGSAR